MKFRCERDVLVEALGTAARAANSRGGALPVLAGVRAELIADELSLTGTDLDMTIQISLTVAGETDGVAVFPAKLIADVVRSLDPGAVVIEVAAEEAQISSGRSEFSLRLIPDDEFPVQAAPTADPLELNAAAMAAALKQVIRSASSDDSRPILTGVLLAAEGDGLRMVATDSYRLAVRDLVGQSILRDDQRVLVPSRALGELARVLAGGDVVELRLGERDASFTVGPVTLTTRLIEGEFPNYRTLIPSAHPNRVTIQRDALLEAVRRVKLLAREATPVRMKMTDGLVELVAITQDVGQAHEEVEATYEGEELTVAFNPDYLLDGVEVAAGDEVTIETIDALKPALLRSSDSRDFLYVLMPVRVA